MTACSDLVYAAAGDVLQESGKSYTVYTPYRSPRTPMRATRRALARVPDRYVHEPWAMPPLIAEAAGCVAGRDYPAPIIDHAAARTRALVAYGGVLSRS